MESWLLDLRCLNISDTCYAFTQSYNYHLYMQRIGSNGVSLSQAFPLPHIFILPMKKKKTVAQEKGSKMIEFVY